MIVLKIKESLKSDYEDEQFYLFLLELNESKQTKEINENSNDQQIQELKKVALSNPNMGDQNLNEENQTLQINITDNLNSIEEKNDLGSTEKSINEELKNLILLNIDYDKKKMKNFFNC